MSEVKLPEGWVEAKIEQVSIKGLQRTPSEEESFIYVDIGSINREKKIIESPQYLIGSEAPSRARKVIKTGDVLVSLTRPNLNAVALVGETYNEQIASTGFEIIRPILVDSRYLFALTRYRDFIDSISGLVQGALYPAAKSSDVQNYKFALAPLAEQKIIAEKLDTLLAQVDSTKARLEQIPKILKRFRQSVLAAAMSGRLTDDWRKDNKINNSTIDFKKEIKDYRFKKWQEEQLEKFSLKGKIPKNDKWKEKYIEPTMPEDFDLKNIPDSWIHEKLEGLIYISARIGWKGLKASEYTEKGPLFLSVHSLNHGKEVNLSVAYHISQYRYDESPEIRLKNDDILLCKDGAGIGKLAIIKNLKEPATINSSLLLIRAGKFFVPEYLYYYLSGPNMQNIVQERMTGSAVPHLFQRDVKEFILEVPPLPEQAEIVRRVEQLFAYADAIEKQVNSALSRVNNLTQSILAKAFRGELTAQWRAENPDLISGENSAAALLEKIKAERAASGGTKKATRKKA
jgi:type I restriction enzyme S subunit